MGWEGVKTWYSGYPNTLQYKLKVSKMYRFRMYLNR